MGGKGKRGERQGVGFYQMLGAHRGPTVFLGEFCRTTSQEFETGLYSDCQNFFRLINVIVGAQRAVPSGHRRARQAVPLQNEITFGNRYMACSCLAGPAEEQPRAAVPHFSLKRPLILSSNESFRGIDFLKDHLIKAPAHSAISGMRRLSGVYFHSRQSSSVSLFPRGPVNS